MKKLFLLLALLAGVAVAGSQDGSGISSFAPENLNVEWLMFPFDCGVPDIGGP